MNIRYLVSSLLLCVTLPAWAATPIFSVTPFVYAPSQLIAEETGTAIYQVTNTSWIWRNALHKSIKVICFKRKVRIIWMK